ncbi:MAG TPA: lipoyl(octanoyl) transferase LipB [Solirubrobacteraceae bacterium]|jgi:lipoyl(octanoyl) transferase|nr:lipoyl(octanoyl) transferase LipB [Solirubrobacteraceae bacterium]
MRTVNGSRDELWVCHLGVVRYRDALAVQQQLCARRQADELPDTLLLLEHPPVYTRGRRSEAEDLPLGEDFYRAKGIDVEASDRGGRLTYHGPGQLVGYPIMRIDDVHRYLRSMEDAIIVALAGAGVNARSRHDEGIDYTGVWVQERKIASIGVHVSRGVTTHGFAVNVDNDLDPFTWVVACGLPDVAMTSIAQETAGAGEGLACFRKRVAFSFAEAHGRRQRLVSPTRLGIDTAHADRRAERAPIKTISAPLVEPVPA